KVKVNKQDNKFPHPRFAVDFNGKNFLKLQDLKIDYDLNNYTFVVSYLPYAVNNKDPKEGEDTSKASDKVKECQEKLNKEYAKQSESAVAKCSNEKEENYSQCFSQEYQKLIKEANDNYQKCIGGNSEAIKDAVVNKQGIFNVCASDNFAVRPKLIRYADGGDAEFKRYPGGIEVKQDFQRFKAENENGEPAYGYHAILNDTMINESKQNNAHIINKAHDAKYQSPVSVIAPILPNGCKPNNVEGVTEAGELNRSLWKHSGIRLGADFRLRDKDSNIIYEDEATKRQNEELNKYRTSVAPNSKSSYTLYSNYSEYGFVYTTPNALNTGKNTNGKKVMSLEYYNIGWAGFTLVDSIWTLSDYKENSQGVSDCIKDGDKAFSNDPTTGNDAGRVGCSIGLVVDKPIKGVNKDEQKWVYAAFDYDKVDIDLLDLKDKFNETDKTNGILNGDNSRPVNFTYFYNGEPSKDNSGRKDSYISVTDLDKMGAIMDLKASARLYTKQTNAGDHADTKTFYYAIDESTKKPAKRKDGTLRGVIPTLFDKACYAQKVTFDMDNEYMPRAVSSKNAEEDKVKDLSRHTNKALQSSRDWQGNPSYGRNTMFIQGDPNSTAFISKERGFEFLSDGFKDGVNNGDFYINFPRYQEVPKSGSKARSPLIIVAEDFVAKGDMVVCGKNNCSSDSDNDQFKPEPYDPKDIKNSFITSRDREIGGESFYSNELVRTTDLKMDNLGTNKQGVARFYYANFNNPEHEPTQQRPKRNVSADYFIQPMVFCAEEEECFKQPFSLLALKNGETKDNLIIHSTDRPNFYLNRAFEYKANKGIASVLSITDDLRKSYKGGDSSVDIKSTQGTVLTNGNSKPYSEKISVSSTTSGNCHEVHIEVKPWFLSDYSSHEIKYNRFCVAATGESAWAGEGGVKKDSSTEVSKRNVGSFLDDSNTMHRDTERRTNRVTW
ncbi:MAG: hypothetical protein ACTTIM_06910, partial [Campylobacter sp.]